MVQIEQSMQVLQRKVRGASVIRKGQKMFYKAFYFPIITAHNIVSAHVTLDQQLTLLSWCSWTYSAFPSAG